MIAELSEFKEMAYQAGVASKPSQERESRTLAATKESSESDKINCTMQVYFRKVPKRLSNKGLRNEVISGIRNFMAGNFHYE